MPPRQRRYTDNWSRLPTAERAGTHIDHANAQGVYASIGGQTQKIGLIDHRQRVLQVGGELNNFVFWKERLVSLPEPIWSMAQGKVDYIEVIDHNKNRCYRLDATVFAENARHYNAGIGDRVGADFGLWSISGGPVEPVRTEPSGSANAPTQTSMLP